MVATKLHVRLQNPRDTGCCRQNSATTQNLQDICVFSAPVFGSLETGGDLCWFIYVCLKASLVTERDMEGNRCDLIWLRFKGWLKLRLKCIVPCLKFWIRFSSLGLRNTRKNLCRGGRSCGIWLCQGRVAEDYNLLRCYAVNLGKIYGRFEGRSTSIFSVKQSQVSSWTAWSSTWRNDPPKFRQPFINRHGLTYRQIWFFISEVHAEKRIGILICNSGFPCKCDKGQSKKINLNNFRTY